MDTKKTTAALRKESHSIFNRVHSIAEDATFVNKVYDNYHLPLLPNMRCGAWYTDPRIVCTGIGQTHREPAYFKSTDGHTNNWSFSLRRPNLHVLPLIVKHAGLILVDSTRAGKRIPDALSKTVPIWCAVVNRTILMRVGKLQVQDWDTALYTPPGSVSPQEHSQIEGKLDEWASELAASSYSLPTLGCPLRPIWITPATTVFPTFPKQPDRTFYPIICVTASKQVVDGVERRASGFAYIQGSGDDHELWGMGLTPDMYWRHCDELLAVGPSELPDLVRSFVATASHLDDVTGPDQTQHSCGTPIQHILGRISLCRLSSLPRPNLIQTHPDTAFVCCTPDDPTWLAERNTIGRPGETPRMLGIQIPPGKRGQHRFLGAVLPRSVPFIQHHLRHGRAVCIACSTGTDTSVGVAVAALAMFFHPDGSFCAQGNVREDMSKDVLKTRLQWIISSYPQANPSRTTLKRVNDFLLSPFAGPWVLGMSSPADHASDLEVSTHVTDAIQILRQ